MGWGVGVGWPVPVPAPAAFAPRCILAEVEGWLLMMKKPNNLVFSGDIGGTKIRLGLWEVGHERLRLLEDWTVASPDFSGLMEAINSVCPKAELRNLPACFGVAGPVRAGRASLTNVPWIVDAEEIQRELGLGSVLVINDLEATAWAVPAICPEFLVEIKVGVVEPKGPVAILAAGTGLGQACLIREWDSPVVISGEGGHADFAPRNSLEGELHGFLAKRHGHVSWERVLSGPGLVDLAEFFVARSGRSVEDWFESEMSAEDPAAAVSAAGLDGSDTDCVAALDLFVAVYGAQAGNAALTFGATGGVLLAGGMAPKLAPALLRRTFVESFLDKGRMRAFLEEIQVSILADEDAPLKGAALRAATAG